VGQISILPSQILFLIYLVFGRGTLSDWL
jgi:hypothetical protein